MYEQITKQANTVVTELLEQAKLKPGSLLVIGCSSSEMVGQRIGKGSSMEAAQAAFSGIAPELEEQGIEMAVQCCEHLNRALIMERRVAEKRGYEIVNVVPQPKAGGSFAVTAWNAMEDPVAVEEIKAEAGSILAEPSSVCTCAVWPSPSAPASSTSAKPWWFVPAPVPSMWAAPGQPTGSCKTMC